MELRHLRYFIAVAEELHFGRAADRLHIAQPPLSIQIRKLEQEIGVQLLYRTKRVVSLSEAGRAFLQKAYAAVAAAEEGVRIARQADRGESGRLSIGFGSSFLYSMLPQVIRAFRARSPAVVLNCLSLRTDEQVQMLLNGQIDVGLLRPPIDERQLSTMLVYREPLIVALPDVHPLADRKSISLKALASDRFIMFRRHMGPNFYDRTVALCQKAGITPNVVQEADQTQTIIGLVAAGIGVGVVPGSMQNVRRPGVVYTSIMDPDAVVDVMAAWRRDSQSQCLRVFLDVIRQVAAEETERDVVRLGPAVEKKRPPR